VVESLKVVTRAKTERIARYAFDFALKNNRKKVTIIHKANIMKQGDGLFLNVAREVGKNYASAGIKVEDMIVDNASMQVSYFFWVLEKINFKSHRESPL
jgi:isocitrate dehydrogenase (NAD+)